MSGYDFVSDVKTPHVGGNIWQGDPWTYAPTAWRYIVGRFCVRSVLDVGSGRGHAAHWFAKNGCAVVAIDASMENVTTALHPTVHCDLLNGPLTCPVDLAHCQEVAEHIPEIYVGNFISTLANGSVIVMTHGEPGQPGHHHVNCQPADYWKQHVEAAGYHYLPDDTDRVRHFAALDGAHHLSRSGLVFGRRRDAA